MHRIRLGLEFSVSRLLKSGKSIVVGGLCYIGINFVSGLLLGWLMGFPLKEMMVICGIMTSWSTAIVAKVLVDLKRTANPETEIIMGMIMFDDLFIAVHISILSGLVLSGDSSFWSVLAVRSGMGSLARGSAYDDWKHALRLYRGARGRHFRACLDQYRLDARIQGRILKHYGQYWENGRAAAGRSVVRRAVCAYIGRRCNPFSTSIRSQGSGAAFPAAQDPMMYSA